MEYMSLEIRGMQIVSGLPPISAFFIIPIIWAVTVLIFTISNSLCTQVFFHFTAGKLKQHVQRHRRHQEQHLVRELNLLLLNPRYTSPFSKHSFYLTLVQSSGNQICYKATTAYTPGTKSKLEITVLFDYIPQIEESIFSSSLLIVCLQCPQ